ncbi:MAG TPA: secondary thiamine-phosphate synthase enzyme YjbQ [Candidatus Thermoplasmatota archaeon]|nr:secondary thiamine-phosphate synthase enzyme YjbQ [Candidatus Thermoplasmatota archaeon]
MRQFARDLHLRTKGEVEVRDITGDVARLVRESGVRTGQALVFSMSSTSAVTITEFEPGLAEEDLPAALERLFPRGLDYGHERRWRDGNGHSHVRAAFLKPDLTVPVREGKPHLGTWQQIVFVELDNKPRERTVAVHVWGE